ncbi:hypothetical protein WG66_005437 [Moniliophthora roreri]|nr:hypothetical protein WG66_005437 [Moniliophthora roreri]
MHIYTHRLSRILKDMGSKITKSAPPAKRQHTSSWCDFPSPVVQSDSQVGKGMMEEAYTAEIFPSEGAIVIALKSSPSRSPEATFTSLDM